MGNSIIVKKYYLRFIIVFIFGLVSLSSSGPSISCWHGNFFDVVSFDVSPVIDNCEYPLAVGTVYRFANSFGAINEDAAFYALAEILEHYNMLTPPIDFSNFGLARAFQPRTTTIKPDEVRAPFHISLVNTRTKTPKTNFYYYESPFNIDGDRNIPEFSDLSLVNTFTKAANKQMETTRKSNGIPGRNVNNVSAPVDPIYPTSFYTFNNYYENKKLRDRNYES
jgi:hypothetical protein